MVKLKKYKIISVFKKDDIQTIKKCLFQILDNSKKIVIKLGSTTVIDKKGNFKKDWVNSLKDIKKYKKKR